MPDDGQVIHSETSTKPPSKRALQQMRLMERRTQVMQLRRLGLDYREIGSRLGVDPKTAWNDLRAAFRATIAEDADEVRKLELARLDMLWRNAIAIVVGTDANPTPPELKLRAMETALRIMARKAVMEGLDKPQKVDLGPWLEKFAEEQGLEVGVVMEQARQVVAKMGF